MDKFFVLEDQVGDRYAADTLYGAVEALQPDSPEDVIFAGVTWASDAGAARLESSPVFPDENCTGYDLDEALNKYLMRDDVDTAKKITDGPRHADASEIEMRWVLDDDVPYWIEQDITVGDCRNIVRGGCASGAYMPAVTYYKANAIMDEYGDDVLQFIDEHLGDDLPAPPKGCSWSGIACHYLSLAVEIWAGHALAETGYEE